MLAKARAAGPGFGLSNSYPTTRRKLLNYSDGSSPQPQLYYYAVVVVVVTRHGGVATFAEAVFKLQPQDTATDRNVPG